MKNKPVTVREELCNYLSELAKEKSFTHEYIAKKTGFERSNVSRMLSGKYAPSLDNLIILTEVIGYDISIVEKLGKVIDTDRQPKFLIFTDPLNNESFILHRQYPPCLIQVIKNTSIDLEIRDIYTTDIKDLNEITKMPFFEEAKKFWIENT